MSEVGQRERMTQDRVVRLFTGRLGYAYLGNWQDRPGNSNIEEKRLRAYLKQQGYSDELITRAMEELIKTAGDQINKPYYVNKAVYSLLRYGVKVRENMGENNQTVHLINWTEPVKNDFALAEEVSIKGEHTKRPDIVLYVNGIALGVLELKNSTTSVNNGIRQNLDNQSSVFIRPFFHTMQLVMAGNDTEGMRYGTIETKDKYYLAWKEDKKANDRLSQEVRGLMQEQDHLLDKHLASFCHPERLLEMIHDFVVFDRGAKKLCRPNQYFGVKAAAARVQSREGGIIWHTQGSGKSLTMVWLAKWIRENIPDSRILIITDRDELDKQIEKVFKGVDEDIYRTKSGKDLLEKLNATTPMLMNSLVHKFGRKEGELNSKDYDQFIQELKDTLEKEIKDFKAKGDLYVFVDECHRTQSGKLNEAMKLIMPNALFIGFTGTPLLKKDKKSSIEVFGSYIHTYKFDEAVEDQVVLDLQYEARDIEQEITSQEKIDEWFEAKTRGLTDVAKVKLKQRWGTLQKVLSSQSRLSKIVSDIVLDMEKKPRLQNGRGNAMLIAGSIYEACRYYELFQQAGLKKCAIVTSYEPHVSHIKGEATGEDDETENVEKYEIYQKMLKGRKPEVFEEEAKKQFVEEPAQMKLLIVVDKLLTGFDAPPATYLYIDKSMKDHGLFQAICRVNRLDGEDKEYGYIIDYKDLFRSLEQSVADYTSEAFGEYEKEDVEGLLKDRLQKAKEKLDTARESIKALCEPVEPPKNTREYLHYFCSSDTGNPESLKETEPRRQALYKMTTAFIRSYANLADEMEKAGYSAAEAKEILQETKYYDTIRNEVMNASGDYIDLKSYEASMRYLIDTYISAQESRVISTFDDLPLVDLLVQRGQDAVDSLPEGIKKDEEAAAETIENNVRRRIIDETPTNPKYYEKMSRLLDTLIQQRRQQAISYQEYLKQIVEMAKNVAGTGAANQYPAAISASQARKALYDNLMQDETLAVTIDEDIRKTKPDGWRGNKIKERKVKYAISRHLEDEEMTEEIFQIVKKQVEY